MSHDDDDDQDQPLQAGDVVRLRSGGPEMTISHIDANGEAFCHWFDDEDNLHDAHFSLDALQLAE